MKHSSIRNIIILAILAIFALTSVVPTASAACAASDNCTVNGYIKLSGILTAATEAKSNGHEGLTIINATNTSQLAITNATGGYNLTNVLMGANSFKIKVHESGYEEATVTITVAAASLANQNFTVTAETPTISSIAESGISREDATITASLPNTTMGAYLQYSLDTNFGGTVYTEDWSNGSASLSFSLTELGTAETYYYRIVSYNTYDYNQTTTSSTGDFETGRGTASSYKAPAAAAATAAVQQNIVQQIISPKSSDAKKKQIFVGLVILAAGVLYYYGMLGNKGTGKGGKKK